MNLGLPKARLLRLVAIKVEINVDAFLALEHLQSRRNVLLAATLSHDVAEVDGRWTRNLGQRSTSRRDCHRYHRLAGGLLLLFLHR